MSSCTTRWQQAKATGFRPCKRCNPDGVSAEHDNAAIVARACRLIEQSEREPSLADLAKAAGRSASRFHRLFKAVTGLTPKGYAAARRATKVRQSLAHGNSVTETIYGAGFNSSGRFYEKATGMLGMTPSQYRSGGCNEDIRFAVGETSLGTILVASSRKGVVSILLGDEPEELVQELQDRFPNAHLIGADRSYENLVARVVGFVEAPVSVSTCRSMCAAPPSSNGFGRPYSKSRSGGPSPTLTSPATSARRRRCAPLPVRAPPIILRSQSPVTGWCETTVRSRATRGAWNASASS